MRTFVRRRHAAALGCAVPDGERHNPKADAALAVDGVADVLLTLDAPDADTLLCAIAAARERAERALCAFDAQDAAAAAVPSSFAGELLAMLAADPAATAELVHVAVTRLAAAQVLSPLASGREALRSPILAALAPRQAVRAVLRLVSGCARPRCVSLWSAGGAGELVDGGHEGLDLPGELDRRVAGELIAGEPEQLRGRGPLGLAITRAGMPAAALVARPRRGAGAGTAALLAEAAAPLAWILERETLLALGAASERALLQASERRLTRLGFDLHDGPLQELLVIGEELALFREQLGVVLEGRRGKELLGGRLDDLDARLLALERGLRRISTSVHAGVVDSRPFAEAFEHLLAPFVARTGIAPDGRLEGDLDEISQSQRMAVLSVVGEALNNIREHSAAASVAISVIADADGVRARVWDDGRGFDVEAELLRAARRGHMGLAGVYERVRLLGGHCRVESRPGGPSEIAIALPRWQAPAQERASAHG
jgi:signal transduction histidine kinase